ncbi:MAG: FliM/FliN family flagellar motor C-terminal domain-containing protein [Actinomycetia bacterium]|nr:FliM/FliN family flagellar motor C-terminal domain-containing protein [Actinomycetes bacterium]
MTGPEAGGLTERITRLPVRVKVVLGSTTLMLHQVAQLQRGSTVLLGQRVSEPVRAVVGRRTVFRGSVYAKTGHYAVRVEDRSE